jgi:predicted O-methyltransferase YrrM
MTVCCVGHYQEIVAELLECLLESRLYDRSQSIELALLGKPKDRAVVAQLVRPLEKFRIGYRSDDLEDYEFPALGLLQDACRDWSGLVYYLHTKGVSREPGNQYARYWRMLMLDHVVMGHETCVQELRRHDAVGTNWRGNHFSGNFWWARAAHIRRLPDVRALQSSPRPISRDPVWNLRLQCEFWLSMARGRFKNLGVAGLDLFRTIRWSVSAADVVNQLLEVQGGDRYLELVDGPSSYASNVKASVRKVVPSGARSTSSGHPEDGEGTYDVVFVDCWHEEAHCLRVLEWCLERLSDHGAIVVHDSNPPTAWHQRPAAEFEPGTEWNGEVWKAVARFRLAHPEIDVRTVDTDWGCTVIRPAVPATAAFPRGVGTAFTWQLLLERRADLLNVVSVRRFRRDLYCVPFMAGRSPIASHTELLNCLISLLGLERYLEMSLWESENFGRIIAPLRQSISPQGAPTWRMTSDEFFIKDLGYRRYDLIFVDGNHEEAQCLRDIEHAVRRLSASGCVVVHDTNPPTEWHQRPAADYRPGEEWNGTAWKAVVRFRRQHPNFTVTTFDLDWGCTVIRASATRQRMPPPLELTWATLCEHRAALLNLRPPTWAELLGALER